VKKKRKAVNIGQNFIAPRQYRCGMNSYSFHYDNGNTKSIQSSFFLVCILTSLCTAAPRFHQPTLSKHGGSQVGVTRLISEETWVILSLRRGRGNRKMNGRVDDRGTELLAASFCVYHACDSASTKGRREPSPVRRRRRRPCHCHCVPT